MNVQTNEYMRNIILQKEHNDDHNDDIINMFFYNRMFVFRTSVPDDLVRSRETMVGQLNMK